MFQASKLNLWDFSEPIGTSRECGNCLHFYLPRKTFEIRNVVYLLVISHILTTSSSGLGVRIPDSHLRDPGSKPSSGGRIFFSFFISI